MSGPTKASLLFCRLVDLALALGATSIGDLPGCWEYTINSQWRAWINGHPDRPVYVGAAAVPPFHAYLEFNGWPAGLFSVSGGSMAAGSVANEETLLAIVDEAVRAAEDRIPRIAMERRKVE